MSVCFKKLLSSFQTLVSVGLSHGCVGLGIFLLVLRYHRGVDGGGDRDLPVVRRLAGLLGVLRRGRLAVADVVVQAAVGGRPRVGPRREDVLGRVEAGVAGVPARRGRGGVGRRVRPPRGRRIAYDIVGQPRVEAALVQLVELHKLEQVEEPDGVVLQGVGDDVAGGGRDRPDRHVVNLLPEEVRDHKVSSDAAFAHQKQSEKLQIKYKWLDDSSKFHRIRFQTST